MGPEQMVTRPNPIQPDPNPIQTRSNPSGALEAEPSRSRWVGLVCIVWSLFQLWVAADFPFYLSEITGWKLVFNNQEARQIHLAFGLGLALGAYPVMRSLHPRIDPFLKGGLLVLGVAACLYLYIFKLDIANRAGLPNRADLLLSLAGIFCVMVAVYRVVGLPLVIVAGC